MGSGPRVRAAGIQKLRMAPEKLEEIADAAGAGGYALVGLGGLVFAGTFLKNFLPFGIPGHLLSGGQID
ncbi:MAG TPA: hypothetical protein VGH38_22265, partial [Bryobacteraceae bacterium]